MRMLLSTFVGGLGLFAILLLLVGFEPDEDCAETLKDIDV